MTDLAQALADDTDTRDRYTRYYPVEGEPQLDDSTIGIYRCYFGEERQAPRTFRSSVGSYHRLQFQSGVIPEVFFPFDNSHLHQAAKPKCLRRTGLLLIA